jgi:DNA-binding MarR family transcriptional regulator
MAPKTLDLLDPIDPIGTWERFVRVHRAATTEMDRTLRNRYGRSLDDYDVMHQITAYGAPIRMGELAERLLVANSSCTRIVGRLVDVGLVSRVHEEADRRSVLAELTAAGRRLYRRMAATHTRDIERLVATRLTAVECERLDHALQRLLR